MCRMTGSRTSHRDRFRGKAMDEQPSATRFLVLGTLETLLNQMLDLSPGARERLAELHGTVVRVRAERPMLVVYLLIYEDGIEVIQDFEGHIDVRIRAPLGALLQWLVSPAATRADEDGIRILGPEELVTRLSEAMADFNLWQGARQWLEQHVRIDQLLSVLRREDPEWLERLQSLPGQFREMTRELARQRLLQEDILEELRSLKTSLGHERRMDLLCLFAGLAFLLAALATATGHLPAPVLHTEPGLQVLLLASIGLTLVLSRVLFGHRYG